MTDELKRTYLKWIGITLAVMFILPLVAAKCVPPDFGMAVCILLFYIVNPFYCLIIGILAGNNMRGRWELPIISAVTIQLGTWLFFDMYDPVFLRYTVAYLCIGVLAMLITNYIKRK